MRDYHSAALIISNFLSLVTFWGKIMGNLIVCYCNQGLFCSYITSTTFRDSRVRKYSLFHPCPIYCSRIANVKIKGESEKHLLPCPLLPGRKAQSSCCPHHRSQRSGHHFSCRSRAASQTGSWQDKQCSTVIKTVTHWHYSFTIKCFYPRILNCCISLLCHQHQIENQKCFGNTIASSIIWPNKQSCLKLTSFVESVQNK